MRYFAAIVFLLSVLASHAGTYEKFKTPGREFGEYAFWWWTWDKSDKWSREGITKNLEEMSEKGMAGVMLFTIGGANNPGNVEYMGEDFKGLFVHAAEECSRLGLRLAFQICDGWATAGGKWITPELSMKKLVQEGFVVLGGADFSEKIKQPETVGGYYKDIAVLAFPHGAEVLSENEILDLTANLSPDGTFTWRAPEGKNWTVIRYGFTITGARNGPAKASGYECDKLDQKGIEAQFANQAKVLLDACAHLPAENRPIPWQDSYEAGPQNWTERMPELFRERNGYDIGKFLLTFSTETPVVSAAATQKFKDDFWGTVWDSMRNNYVGRLKGLANAEGRPLISETYPEEADIPVGEFWLISRNDLEHIPLEQRHCGNPEDFDTAIWTPNTWPIAKYAQFKGRNVIGAEAWTTRSPCFERTFTDLKYGANFVFAQGVNMLIHHNFVNQWDDAKPGDSNHGVAMNINQTWWDDIAHAWFAYIARSQYMLRLGLPSLDVLAIDSSPDARAAEGAVPRNYTFAACKPGDFLKYARVENGVVKNPVDNEFKAVLVVDGAVDDEVAEKLKLCENVFFAVDGGIEKLKAAIAPDIKNLPPQLNFIHRKSDGLDVYFVSNSSKAPVKFDASFRDLKRPAQVWNPENGGRKNLGEGAVEIGPGSGLFFVGGEEIEKLPEENFSTFATVNLDGPWTVRFDERYGAPTEVEFEKLADWTQSEDFNIRHYSSTALYIKKFSAKNVSDVKKVVLDLGRVGEYAKAFLNGQEVATLWTPPFECDISGFVKEGENLLEIKVVNTWANRLIGDAKSDKRYLENGAQFYDMEPYTKDSPLRPSGLMGPVRIYLMK